MGIPAGLLVPLLAARMKNVAILIYAGVAFFIVGYLGLILVPGTATWLWVAFAGLGPLLFPLCLVLINVRTRTHAGSVALSGFTQGLGYTLGALGPLAVGVLHQLTASWTIPLLFLTATALAAAARRRRRRPPPLPRGLTPRPPSLPRVNPLAQASNRGFSDGSGYQGRRWARWMRAAAPMRGPSEESADGTIRTLRTNGK